MMKKVERKKSIATNLMIKQLKETIKYDKIINKMENEELVKIKKDIASPDILMEIDKKICKNNKVIKGKKNHRLNYELKKIIKKVSPTLYEEIPNDVLDAYGLAISYYMNNDIDGLIRLNNDLEKENWEGTLRDLDEVVKLLKTEIKGNSMKTYYKIKESQSKEFLRKLRDNTTNTD